MSEYKSYRCIECGKPLNKFCEKCKGEKLIKLSNKDENDHKYNDHKYNDQDYSIDELEVIREMGGYIDNE
jgi:hypothetical protein